MERIYLEYKPVIGGYGHLYLVKREEFTDPSDRGERNSGDIIRAGQECVVSGLLAGSNIRFFIAE